MMALISLQTVSVEEKQFTRSIIVAHPQFREVTLRVIRP